MGAVYRARDTKLDRLVAVKVMRAELLGDADAQRRFLGEAQSVARLQHPSIVEIFDYGTLPDGGGFLVMELVRGENLRGLLAREGRIDAERTAGILKNVCGALEAAHRQRVLHGDLKPENILLPADGAEPKVVDFGTAGTAVATPAYMAPEQFDGGTPDARTDVFSLGVIAYEMLSGQLPFGQCSLADVVLARSRGVAPISSEVSPALDRAVRAALNADPDRRPATPQAFAHLINAAVGR